MNLADFPNPLVRLERFALFIGGAALLVSALLAWNSPHAVSAAYRLAIFACLAPALGSLFFQLILRLTGGQWGPALQPFFTAGSSLLPWIWVAVFPILFFPGPTGQTDGSSMDLYATPTMVLIRSIVYAAVFFSISRAVNHVNRRRQAGDQTSLRWVAPMGLIVLVFTSHLLVVDWLVALDSGWQSTAFPAVWMTGQALAGLACAIACAVLAGARPAEAGTEERPLGLDWGNLLLAAMMFFTYVAFAQFLIIWGGNLPREISWYLARSQGLWKAIIVALVVVHFAGPFLLLLSRRFKRSRSGLTSVAGVLIAAQIIYLAWVILPAFQPHGWGPLALAITLPVAALALFLNRYLAAARRVQALAS